VRSKQAEQQRSKEAGKNKKVEKQGSKSEPREKTTITIL